MIRSSNFSNLMKQLTTFYSYYKCKFENYFGICTQRYFKHLTSQCKDLFFTQIHFLCKSAQWSKVIMSLTTCLCGNFFLHFRETIYHYKLSFLSRHPCKEMHLLSVWYQKQWYLLFRYNKIDFWCWNQKSICTSCFNCTIEATGSIVM